MPFWEPPTPALADGKGDSSGDLRNLILSASVLIVGLPALSLSLCATLAFRMPTQRRTRKQRRRLCFWSSWKPPRSPCMH